MDKTKALYLPFNMAFPSLFTLDKDALSPEDAEKLKKLCPPGTINLNMMEEEFDVEASAIIFATGWKPYDAYKMDNLGFGKCQNVITNVMMERLAARNGPTGGEIIRPSDGKTVENVAFVQCAGSRDENHLPYCSAVCCMGTLKQIRYIREKNKDTKITVFYIDIRTIGREEKFYYDLLDDDKVSFIKGKAAMITEDTFNKDLQVDVEDTITGEKLHQKFDMVVLATGMVPNTLDIKLPWEVNYDQYGFVDTTTNIRGIFSAGCCKRPGDVSRTTKDSTAAVLKAIQWINRGE
jgi:quinone-modifying oxidoreductase subunit QmoA